MVTMYRGSRWKIAVYGRDHGVPHFHIEGAGFRCSVSIASLAVIVGAVPAVVLREALSWARASGAARPDVAGFERMTMTDTIRTIVSARATGPASLHLVWSDGTEADLAMADTLADRGFVALRDPAEFARVAIGDWGHSLAWPSGVELGADSLWLETLSATGHGDAGAFLAWRLRHGLSLSKAAEALGVSRRMVAYYSNGEKTVPKPILLACRGWEVDEGLHRAA